MKNKEGWWVCCQFYEGSITRSWTWGFGGWLSSFVRSLSNSYDIGNNLSVFFSPKPALTDMALFCLWEIPFRQNSQASKSKAGNWAESRWSRGGSPDTSLSQCPDGHSPAQSIRDQKGPKRTRKVIRERTGPLSGHLTLSSLATSKVSIPIFRRWISWSKRI